MDCTGVKVILGAELRAKEGGWSFAVVRGDGVVRRLLRVARVEERFPIVDAPEQVARAASG